MNKKIQFLVLCLFFLLTSCSSFTRDDQEPKPSPCACLDYDDGIFIYDLSHV